MTCLCKNKRHGSGCSCKEKEKKAILCIWCEKGCFKRGETPSV